jgi:hypothetical protein
MSTLSEQNALDPKSLLYYAPRRLRDGHEAPALQPLPGVNGQPGADAMVWQRANDDAPPLQGPGPESLHYLIPPEHKSELRTPRRQCGRLALAIVGSLTAAAGIATGLVYLDAVEFTGGLGQASSAPGKGDPPAAPAAISAPTLTVADARGTINEALPLGLKVLNYAPGATVVFSGLLKDAKMSAGAASGPGEWRIAVDDLPNARVLPPHDYRGPMNVIAELRGGNGRAIVRSPVHFAWTAAASGRGGAADQPAPADKAPANGAAADTPRRMDEKEIAALLDRAEALVSSGDLPAARLLLRRVADAHNARAAFELGATYDPNVIKQLAGDNALPDPALAKTWYQRAQQWGLSDAAKRLGALASAGR